MRHPEALLVPLVMFADYFLTVYGAILSDKAYGLHFRTQNYELNPVFQKAIAGKRWFSPRHAMLTIVVSAFIIGTLEIDPDLGWFAGFLLGMFFGVFGFLLARHLSNILTFRRLIRHPDEVTGEVTMAPTFSIAISDNQLVGLALPMVIIALFTHSDFVYGWLVGMAALFYTHWRWMRRAKRQTPVAPGAEPRP